MTPSELKDSYKLLDGWFEKCGKAHADYHLLKIIKSGLKAGADWSTARILYNNAQNKRLIVMGITAAMRRMPNHFEDIQEFFQHKLYHTFQQDLEMDGSCRRRAEKSKNSNSKWMVEGGARYFAKSMLKDTQSFESRILQQLYERKMDNEALNGESDMVGSAALLLMTNRGLLRESEILDGSLFHNCAREFKFDKNSNEIKFIMKN